MIGSPFWSLPVGVPPLLIISVMLNCKHLFLRNYTFAMLNKSKYFILFHRNLFNCIKYAIFLILSDILTNFIVIFAFLNLLTLYTIFEFSKNCTSNLSSKILKMKNKLSESLVLFLKCVVRPSKTIVPKART